MSFLKVLAAVCSAATSLHPGSLQPLEEFLRGARQTGAADAEARAVSRQSGADADAALGRALPRLSLRGTYTRNQYDVSLVLPGPAGGPPATVTLTPNNQLDGAAVLDVPLVDLASFARIASARTRARAAEAGAAATDLRVQASVSQDYYQLVADVALVASSRKALDVARAGLRIAERRHEAGTGILLDSDRARAEVERNVQQLAGAELQVSLVARALQSETGIAPDLGGEVALSDDLHEEPALETFGAQGDRIPALAQAIGERVASEQQAGAQRLALVPSLSGSATERVTDNAGFAGKDGSWQAVLALNWSFDLTTLANIRSGDAAADAARAREQGARLAVADDIHRAWRTVGTNIARSRSARIQAEVGARAARLALERYEVGDGTQLDLLQAQRDAFAADAARIQADADLVNSRAQLQVAAGEGLLARAAGGAP